MSGQLYQEALENQASYQRKIKQMEGTIRFECILAEEYEVEAADNRFYFFNPFSLQIFTKVLQSILRSIEQHPRTVDIILYYPTSEYIEFLETSTPFELVQGVKVPNLDDQNDNELFLVYRL